VTSPPPPYSPPPPAQWTAPGSPARRPPIVWDIVVTIILLVLLGILTFFISLFGFFLVMASDPCGAVTQCNTELIGMGVLVAVSLPWVVLIAAAVVSIVLLVKRRIAFWVPLAASPLVIASWFVGAAIAAAGVPTG